VTKKSFEGAMERLLASKRNRRPDLWITIKTAISPRSQLRWEAGRMTFQRSFQRSSNPHSNTFQRRVLTLPHTPWALEVPRWKTGPNAGGRGAARLILVFTVAFLRLDWRAARLSEARLSRREQLLAGPRSSGFGVAIRMPVWRWVNLSSPRCSEAF
jgi:hypothetical protein